MRQIPLCVTVLGCGDAADSAAVDAALGLVPRDASIDRLSAFTEEWAERAATSDLCLVLQSWPDEIPAAVAHAVVAACGVSRLVVCQGAWCASDGRTRSVWPRAVCVSVDLLAARIRDELEVLNGEREPLPATAALDEIFAFTGAPGDLRNSLHANARSPGRCRY